MISFSHSIYLSRANISLFGGQCHSSPSSLMARISALRQPQECPKLNTAPPMRRPKPRAPPRRRSPSTPFNLEWLHHDHPLPCSSLGAHMTEVVFDA